MSNYAYWGNCEQNPRPRALSQKEEDEVVAAYESGITQVKIGEMFGVSRQTVLNILIRRGIKPQGQPRFLTHEQEEEIALHYAAGMSTPEIASMFGTTANTIRSALIRQEVPLRRMTSRCGRRKRALSKKEEDEAIAAYESGMTLSEIGEVFGVSYETIGRMLRRRGVKVRKSGRKGLSEEDEAAVIGAYLSGSSGVLLAEAFGVDHKTIYNILERHGIKRRERESHMRVRKGFPDVSRHAVRPEDMPYLSRLYREGLSLREIAEMFEVDLSTISATLKRYGYEVRPKGCRYRGRKEHVITGLEPQIVEDYLAGMTEEQLVQKYAITPREIKEAIDRHMKSKMRKVENPAGGVSTALALASVSFLAIGLGFALRSAKMQRRRDPGPGRTAAIGNSITASSTGYVAFLGREMPSRTFVNMGVVGEGIAAIKRRLERNVIGQQFDEVIIEAGINDIGRNDATTYIPSQLAEMVRVAKQSGLKVVLTTLPPWRGAVAAIASVNNSIKRDGKFWGADVVVDIHRPLADWRGHLRGELVGDRMGLHPNRQGQELIGRAILASAYQ